MYTLLGKEVSVRTSMLQGHAIASGVQAASYYSQRAVIICQSCILYHCHVPQERI